jgi:hypothetical protein
VKKVFVRNFGQVKLLRSERYEVCFSYSATNNKSKKCNELAEAANITHGCEPIGQSYVGIVLLPVGSYNDS